MIPTNRLVLELNTTPVEGIHTPASFQGYWPSYSLLWNGHCKYGVGFIRVNVTCQGLVPIIPSDFGLGSLRVTLSFHINTSLFHLESSNSTLSSTALSNIPLQNHTSYHVRRRLFQDVENTAPKPQGIIFTNFGICCHYRGTAALRDTRSRAVS